MNASEPEAERHPWAGPGYRPEPVADPLPPSVLDAMADWAYKRPPGISARLVTELVNPEAAGPELEPEAGL